MVYFILPIDLLVLNPVNDLFNLRLGGVVSSWYNIAGVIQWIYLWDFFMNYLIIQYVNMIHKIAQSAGAVE